MARFKFKGVPPNSVVLGDPPATGFNIPKSDGTWMELRSAGFVVDADIGTEITDSRALTAMRADPQFEEI